MIRRIAARLHDPLADIEPPRPAERALARAWRPLARYALARDGQLRALQARGREVGASPPPTAGTRVLVLALRAWTAHNAHEATFAQALRLRGADVTLLTCGGGQPLCEVGWSRRRWPRPCDRCGWYTGRVASAAQLRHLRLADYLPWGGDGRRAPAALDDVTDDAAAARRAADVSVPWMLKTTEVAELPVAPAVEEDFSISAAGVEQAFQRILDDTAPDVVVMLNGLFAAERVARAAALERGLRVVTYEMAPRENAIVLSSGVPAPLYDTDAAWRWARERPLDARQSAALDRLVYGRERGESAHETYFADPERDPGAVRAELDIPDGKRVVSMFTNIAWDSAVLHRDRGYRSMADWISTTVAAAAEREDIVLVVRAHPAEVRWTTRQPLDRVLTGPPPANVRVVPANRPLSSYALLELSDLVLAYTTTVGLEAAVRGVPTAVAGETHYRGRGFTLDVDGPEHMRELLARSDLAMDSGQVELARRYAYTFFFHCMVPFPSIPLDQGRPLGLPAAAALLPGGDPYLDFICDRILDGGEFTLPEHLALPA